MQNIKENAIHLSINNISGSVEHYYHFFLGFLVPLVIWCSDNHSENQVPIYIRSCALMDRLILELGYKNLVILEKETHLSLTEKKDYEGRSLEHIYLNGFDSPRAYSKDSFETARKEIQRCLSIDCANYAVSLVGPKDKRIIFIDRRVPAPYYQSDKAEIKGGGAVRRSIPNVGEIESALLNWSVTKVYLEDLTLKEQLIFFYTADAIVAQHGAALANLLFCNPGSTPGLFHSKERFE